MNEKMIFEELEKREFELKKQRINFIAKQS